MSAVLKAVLMDVKRVAWMAERMDEMSADVTVVMTGVRRVAALAVR